MINKDITINSSEPKVEPLIYETQVNQVSKMYEKLGNTAKHIQSIKKVTPKVGLVLGSGLGAFVDRIEDPTIIPYAEIPGFYDCTVEAFGKTYYWKSKRC